MKGCVVFALTDERGCILEVNSSAFIGGEGWTAIDHGYGDRYRLAMGNYFPKPITDERGIPRYRWTGTEAIERTQEEMDADWVEPKPEPSDAERIEQLEQALAAFIGGITSVQ